MAGKSLIKRKFIVTAALIYANGLMHLGHIASTYLPADIFARFLKLKYGKNNVIFVSATDEHGTPIQIKAEECKKPEEEYVSYFRKEDLKDFLSLNILYDVFHHTHSKENQLMTEEFFNKAKSKHLIETREIEALYCSTCKRFLPDRYVLGTCPYCGAENQYGDVCEVCGKTYSPTDLINPKCKICGSKPLLKKTKHYFFLLSKMEKAIEGYLINTPTLQEDAKNYALSWIKEGLKDIDITRDAPYFGFKIPGEKDKYFYVWVDAPLGYISSSFAHNPEIKKWWEDNSTALIHFIGKDIAYFHYLYWPAMLLTLDYILPTMMPTRGYLTINKQKMSKSKGNYILVRDLTTNISNADYIRYYFARTVPDHIADGDFSIDLFKEKVNKELVGNIANLGYRIITLANKYDVDIANKHILDFEKEPLKSYAEILEKAKVKEALEFVLKYATSLNEELNAKEPWKKPNEEAKKIMEEIFKKAVILYVMLEPYIPNIVRKFYEMIGAKKSHNTIETTALQKIEHLAEKIQDEELEPLTGNHLLSQIDLKVGEIKEVEEIKNSEKLYKIKLFDGMKTRQIIAGLKKHYTSEELKGKKVVFVSNLKPAKIFGEISEGMLLAASSSDQKTVGLLIAPENTLAGSDVIIEGFIKKPKSQLDIKEFRKIRFVKKGRYAYSSNPERKLIIRSACGESEPIIERSNEIKDGAELW
ncbi:MAG: methionine--tRNA ligase [Candidatus Nanohaloarchaeota archaeon]|nr:methionine--tRNA ligase [Candidatus Nanohaloarchaeota archaeon]